MKGGQLIAIYGTNNLGKTYQAKILTNFLNEGLDIPTEYIKYPLYDIEPTGSLIDDYLRKGNSFDLSSREFQILQVLNRTQLDGQLRIKLKEGKAIVLEDYIGTGLAWGVAAGVDGRFLENLNEHLVREDLAILLDGERFLAGKEDNHKHEDNDDLIKVVRNAHLELAEKFGWYVVNANQERGLVFKEIMKIVESHLELN